MPATRGVKRPPPKSSASGTSSASSGPKNKKKRAGVQLEIPDAPKKRGLVLACGQGDVGQLGLGEDVVETSKFKIVTALGEKVVNVCAGGMHNVALDSSGKVWTFGCNDEGALGRPTSGDTEEGTPARVTLPRSAVAVAAGDSHSAALLDNGDVYAWGAFRDSHGSMGLVMRGREGKSCREPVKVDIGEVAADIASGGDHLVILSTSGSVYTMGCGEQGQLGRLAMRSASRNARQGFSALLVPAKVTLKASVSRVWAGYHATFALDANNDKMFAWGLNNYGQLGITGEQRKTALYAPTECDAFASANVGWKEVSCGQHHSLALDVNGQVYAIGRCEYGRLGLGENAGDAENLEVVPSLQSKKCVSISAGTSNSFAVTESGEVFGWGMGSEGQLGTGTSSDATEPTAASVPPGASPPDRKPLLVSAGGQHTILLVENPESQTARSPSPEKETAEEKMEQDEKEEVEKKEVKAKPRQNKRQKKQDQEDEVSSTSTAQSSKVAEENIPEKLNGDKKKETPMEVDETDNSEDKSKDTEKVEAENKEKTEQKSEPEQKEDVKENPEETEQKLNQKQDAKTHDTPQEETKQEELSEESEKEPEPTEESKLETTDTSSQETTDSETKSQDSDKPNDVEMKEIPEVNGTEESDVLETKTVEGLLATGNAVTTTA